MQLGDDQAQIATMSDEVASSYRSDGGRRLIERAFAEPQDGPG